MLQAFLSSQEIWDKIEFKATRDQRITGNFEVFINDHLVYSKRLGISVFPPGDKEFLNILNLIGEEIANKKNKE